MSQIISWIKWHNLCCKNATSNIIFSIWCLDSLSSSSYVLLTYFPPPILPILPHSSDHSSMKKAGAHTHAHTHNEPFADPTYEWTCSKVTQSGWGVLSLNHPVSLLPANMNIMGWRSRICRLATGWHKTSVHAYVLPQQHFETVPTFRCQMIVEATYFFFSHPVFGSTVVWCP